MAGFSNLRRLAADHAMLHSNELPPCYIFPFSNADSSVDDLTKLTVFLAGPDGTPYSQGLWRLSLKIPETYPKDPPKATFRTRIWHPNVEENTGSVCVDTLKRDWQPVLNLRDVLITIYCLLIQPNPDSALNATAGHLLQDDYNSFARQARLMTSIHAKIPLVMSDAVGAAKRRGQTARTALGENAAQSPSIKGNFDDITCSQSAPSNPHQVLEGEGPADGGEDDDSTSKENDPLLSPSPVPVPSPRRPSMAKRPLSDLHIIEPECDVICASCLSPSEQNVVNNLASLTGIPASDSSRKGSQTPQDNQSVNKTGRGLQERGANDTGSVDTEGRPTKRICSDSGKENELEILGAKKLIEKPLPAVSTATKVGVSPSINASASSSLVTSVVKGKSRVGLRRL